MVLTIQSWPRLVLTAAIAAIVASLLASVIVGCMWSWIPNTPTSTGPQTVAPNQPVAVSNTATQDQATTINRNPPAPPAAKPQLGAEAPKP